MLKSFVFALVLGLGLAGCCCESKTSVTPERLNDKPSVADQASSRTPEGTMLGDTADKGPQKMDIPILNKILKDDSK